jgi:hypothetical protein
MGQTADRRPTWTFLTNHARVLRIIAANPQVRVRDLAQRIGITERAAQSIVTDLLQAGYLERERHGRRNRYAVIPGRPLRHPSQNTIPVQALLDLFTGSGAPTHAPYPGQRPGPQAEPAEVVEQPGLL